MTSLPVPPSDLAAGIRPLAARYRRANGGVMQAVNALGGRIENRFEALPDTIKNRIEQVVREALTRSYSLAGQTRGALPELGARGHVAAAALTGAAGGAGGLATALAELPVTVTMIFRAVQAVAASHGFDPDADDTRAECLAVFSAASPLAADDGANTGFLGARLTINGASVSRLIAVVAPRLAGALGQKLAAQAIPVIGAVTGAGINSAYMAYYQDMAHVRFGLLVLAREHGHDAVLTAFRTAALPSRVDR